MTYQQCCYRVGRLQQVQRYGLAGVLILLAVGLFLIPDPIGITLLGSSVLLYAWCIALSVRMVLIFRRFESP